MRKREEVRFSEGIAIFSSAIHPISVLYDPDLSLHLDGEPTGKVSIRTHLRPGPVTPGPAVGHINDGCISFHSYMCVSTACHPQQLQQQQQLGFSLELHPALPVNLATSMDLYQACSYQDSGCRTIPALSFHGSDCGRMTRIKWHSKLIGSGNPEDLISSRGPQELGKELQ